MKTKLLCIVLFVALTTMGFECINDPIIVSVKMDPVTGCWHVNPGNGQFGDSTRQVLRDLLDESLRDKIERLRVYDIIVRVTPGYPNGNVSGNGWYGFDTPNAGQHLLSFAGPYSSFANGVSLLNPGGLITYDPVGLPAFIAAISNVDNLPETVVLKGAGGGPAVPDPSFDVCIDIKFIAEANAK